MDAADGRVEDSFVARDARDSARFARGFDHPLPRAAWVRLPAALAIVIGLTAGEILRQGAFYPKDAFGVAVVSGGLIAFELAAGVDRRARRVAFAIGLSALWWWIAAIAHGSGKAFLPLG